jgi:2-polyprenyl-6-methoxyphenol hydroxylase-like FAD-dependent oxidoreductase
VEQFLLDTIQEHSAIRVERPVLPEKLEFDASDIGDDAFPVTVTLRHLNREDLAPAQDMGVSSGLYKSNLVKDDTDELIQKSQKNDYFSETVKAKYVLGCDGAHSWTRRELGFVMEGEQTEYIW